MNIYIGNLSFEVTELELESIFSTFGRVTSTKVVKDHESGRSKGFGFLDITPDSGGLRAIKELNGRDVLGRSIVVSEAKPKEPRTFNRPRNNEPRREGGFRRVGGARKREQ